MKVLFCHGLESEPHGSKYKALRNAGFDVDAPDFRGKNLAERVDILTPFLEDGMLVVGSSYGGLTAVLAAMQTSCQLLGMVLCAPALERKESPNLSPDELQVTAPTIIVHGTQDDVVPVEVSRRFAQKSGATLIETMDGHRLHDSIDQIVQAVNSLANNLEAAEHAACQLFDDEA